MEFIIHYWCANWSELTGLQNGDIIDEHQLMWLIERGEVNVMVVTHDNGTKTCFIDGHNQRFNQR